MASATKVIRVANPRRGGYRLRTNRKRKSNARRRMTPKQIKYFGSARQRAALKASRHRARRRASNPSRPKVKVVYRTRKPATRKRRRRTNPALVVTLGSINPRRRTNKVAKRKTRRRATAHRRTRRTNVHRRAPVRRRRRRTSNPRKVYVMNPPRRRRNTRRHRRHNAHRRHYNRRRNPTLFGRTSPKDMLTLIGGGLVGVTATKFVAGYASSALSSTLSTIGSGGFVSVIVSGVSAFLAGWAASKVSKEFGDAVLFGGLMQTGSVAINAFLPSSIAGRFSLGDLVNGNFVVPQNPIRAAQMAGMAAAAAAAAAPAKSGMGAAYPPAY